MIHRTYPAIATLSLLLISTTIRADYETGVNAAFSGDFETAFREFTIAAEDGLDLAQYNLAILYFTGRGVDQNYEAAYRWTLAAAEQGHLEAQFNLGSLYFSGQGVSQDRSMGLDWFSRAGKAGHAGAAYSLARIFNEGDGVDRDRVQAHAWASMAVKNEHADGEELVNRIERRLSEQELSQARRLFARWQIEF